MAYREFQNEAYYEAPETSGFLAHTLNTLHNEAATRARERRANIDAARRFKFDSEQGKYASDVEILKQNAYDIGMRARNELRHDGQISGETAQMMADHQAISNRSKIDWDTARNVEKQIKELAIRDKYYNPEMDLKSLQEAEYNGGIADRNDRITKAGAGIHGIQTFNKGRFIADHIQQQKLQTMQRVSEASGVTNTRLASAIFMKDDGTPGVTDRHIIEVLNKDPRAEEWYNNAVDRQLDGEIKRMRALGNDERVAWMKGMSDADVKEAIIRNPHLNVINGTSFGERKKDMVRADLAAGQDENHKTSIDYSENASRGGVNNTKIGYNPTFIDQQVSMREQGGPAQSGTVGADLTYIDKGAPIKFVTNSPNRANIGNGEVQTAATDNMEFNLRNYGLYMYDNKGTMYRLAGKNLDELKASIDKIPNKMFRPTETSRPLNPELNIGLNGYTINRSKLLNESLERRSELADEYKKAQDAGDEIKAKQIETRMAQVDQLRAMAGNVDVDDLQLLLTGKQVGVNGIQNDLIVKATDQDLAKLQTITNGLDLRDKNKWTNAMRELNDHYIARRKAAIESTPMLQKKNKPKPATVRKFVSGPVDGQYDLAGKKYSVEAVERAAKASGMTIEQYLDSAEETFNSSGMETSPKK